MVRVTSRWVSAAALASALASAVVLSLTAPAGAQSALPPGARDCVPPIGTNQIVLPLPGVFLPLPSVGGRVAEFATLPLAADHLDLPDVVNYRDAHQGFNGFVDVSLAEGSLYTRPQGTSDAWRKVPTPGCLDGHIVSMSIDQNMLVALDSDGWIYSLDNLLSGPMLWNWTRSFGGPIWLWPGHTVPGDPAADTVWAMSHRMSESFVDAKGITHPTQAGLVQVLSLSEDGSRIVFQDPWLPPDYSYEIGGPLGGRFKAGSISTSESVNFVQNRFGDMYTRKYDLDLAGANHIPGRYTWQDQPPLPSAPNQLFERFDPQYAAISLPAEEWQHQPKIPGQVTSRISVIDTGTRMEDKELRVEGIRDGRTGYWHKDLTADSWVFTPTDTPLAQPVLSDADPTRDQSTVDLAAASDLSFQGSLPNGWMGRVEQFDWAQSRHTATLTAPSGREFPVRIYTTDGLRQTPRGSGLDQQPRAMEGAIDLRPAEPWAPGNEELAEFARTVFGGKDVYEIAMNATTTELAISTAGALEPLLAVSSTGVVGPHLGTWTRY
ncbi:hypothetical protein [Dietzia sp. ANT_WB102]|uniref:hypothetical protein n=1 Tax=Dietzia sp. ANT_WB102 TaxID=2597345 RepID=UPI00165DB186|nr:hypothetical protein [Dietzia sp. ANT_WB102]